MRTAFVQRIQKLVGPSVTAAEGLAKLGYEVVGFDQAEAEALPVCSDTLVVGFIEVVRGAVARLTGSKPPVLNYPAALKHWLHRLVWQETLKSVRNEPVRWPLFIKPANDIKNFGGRVVHGVRDLVDTSGLPNDEMVWASTPVKFESEYRCFVQGGDVIGCRHYKGDPLRFPVGRRVRQMVAAWEDAPRAYCLDVGVVRKEASWQTALIEVNDAYSAGDYGLDPLLYARFLEARWCEMTGAKPIP